METTDVMGPDQQAIELQQVINLIKSAKTILVSYSKNLIAIQHLDQALIFLAKIA